MRTKADLDYRILRSGVDALDILAVPAADQSARASRRLENIREWTVRSAWAAGAPQAARTRRPAHAGARQRLRLEDRDRARRRRLAAKTVALPLIQADGVERQSGTLSLHVDPDLVAEVADLPETPHAASRAARRAAQARAGRSFGENTAISAFRTPERFSVSRS